MKRNPTKKQLVARRLFAKRARSGEFRQNTSRRRSTAKPAVGSRAKTRRRNIEMGYRDSTGFHPIRVSLDYDGRKTGEKSAGGPLERASAALRKRSYSRGRPARNPDRKTLLAYEKLFAKAVTKSPAGSKAHTQFTARLSQIRRLLARQRNGITLAERHRNKQNGVMIVRKAKRVVIKNRKQSNPKRPFNTFRGRPARSTYDTVTSDRTPTTGLKEAGRLHELRLRGGRVLRFTKGKLLYKGNNLYFGGIRLRKPNPPGELDYGEVTHICYQADKPHLEGDGKKRLYEHRFGEEGGARPHLVADAEGMPFLEGGSYRVSPEGIVN